MRISNPLAAARSALPFGLACLALVSSLVGCTRDPSLGTRAGSPADDLPPWITLVLPSGLRPDWSADRTHLVYLDALVGNVFELALATGESRPLTAHFDHEGFTRARYLANGDLLLCGPVAGSAGEQEREEEGEAGGRWQTELWFLAHDASAPAQRLGEPCFEGPAVSRRDMKIAWTRSDYPEKIVFARSEIWTGRIELEGGEARLIDKTKVVERGDFWYLAFLETQDFRPPDDRELLFTAYAYKGGVVMGVDLQSGDIIDYSNDWGYDEAEGVFPDGRSIAVERELATCTAVPKGDIDIWQLALDGSGTWRRLTHFSEYAGYGANNPVVSPDGKKMAFGLRIKGGEHGNGEGIFVYDFEAAPR
jgi:hypothetical protein